MYTHTWPPEPIWWPTGTGIRYITVRKPIGKACLAHDNQPNRIYRETSKTAHELQQIGPKLVNLKIKNRVAIFYSKDAADALTFMPAIDFNQGWYSGAYQWMFVSQMHKVLYKNNISCDFIFPEKPNFNNYDLVIIPSLYVATDSLLKAISDYVKNGGHVIMQFKSGFCNEYNAVRPMMAPGILRQACGFTYQEFQNISSEKLKDNPLGVAAEKNEVKIWAEYLMPETAKILAMYDNKHLNYPAITDNKFGKGSLVYEGCYLSDDLQEKVLTNKAKELGIIGDQNIKFPVVVKKGINDAGKTIVYILNYSDNDQTITYPGNTGNGLVGVAAVSKGQSLTIKPWDVMIVEEK